MRSVVGLKWLPCRKLIGSVSCLLTVLSVMFVTIRARSNGWLANIVVDQGSETYADSEEQQATAMAEAKQDVRDDGQKNR